MKRQGALSIDEILKELVNDNSSLKSGIERVNIFQAWDSVVGTKGASATTYKFFRDGILYCTISSSALRSQLYFGLQDILREINASLGSPVVNKIILK